MVFSCSEADLNRGSKDEDRGNWAGRKEGGRGCQEDTETGSRGPTQGMNRNLLAEAQENLCRVCLALLPFPQVTKHSPRDQESGWVGWSPFVGSVLSEPTAIKTMNSSLPPI